MKRRVSQKATGSLTYSFAPVVTILSLLTILFSPASRESLPEYSSQKEKNYHLGSEAFILMPQPDISGKRFACPNSTAQYQTPNVPGNTYAWSLSAGGNILSQTGSTSLVEWTGPQGGGPYILQVTETDPNGGVATDTFHVYIQNILMACNDTIQLSLDATGVAILNPDQILEGTYIDFSGFTVSISGGVGQNFGNRLTCNNIGRFYRVTVTGECDQNSCWGTVYVEDKLPPIFDCPVDTIELECYENPDDVPYPIAVDNCDPNPIVNLIGQEADSNDPCPGRLLKRTFGAADRYNNRSAECIQYIRILPPAAPTFPDDISWTCEQYAAFPNIVNPTTLHPCLLNNAAEMDKSRLYGIYGHGDDEPGVDPYDPAIPYWTDNEDLDVTLDPRYDDNIDNPLTDTKPNQLDPVTGLPIFSTYGNATTETDDRPDICNLTLGLFPYLDTVVDNRPHHPLNIVFPIHRGLPQIRGLEDADVLEATGSGQPRAKGSACPLSVTFQDQKLEACDGVDTNIVFKILRNWTIVNWCTGEIFTDLQVIKVIDHIAPSVFVDTISIHVDPQPNFNPHQECTSTGLLPPPVVTDNCQTDWTVQIFTPVGEAIYTNGVDGKNGGRIPHPGLKVGIHTIKYVATDACGNRTEYFVDIRIIDQSIPVMICREFTEVSLTSDGTGRVKADKFNEGSYDNCCLDSFVVKRMDEPDSLFRPYIVFDCADIGNDSLMIVLRAYDCSGNFNQCMIEVTVQDKLRPVCDAPDDIWTTCVETHHLKLDDTLVLQRLFGEATAIDNCGAWVKELTPDVDVDVCGIGTVIRRFIATDSSGNQSLGLCRQTIYIKAHYDYKINFPADWIGKCGDIEKAPKLTFTQDLCDRLGYTYEDLRFDISSDGACYKIIRTWTIMNWCAYDGHSAPIQVPHHIDGVMVTDTTYDAFGFYQYQQIIKVVDDVPPVITYNGPTEFCGGYTQACTGDVNILPDIEELCTADLDIKWKLDLYDDGNNDINGINRFQRSLPFGRHKLIYEVKDGCGNRAQKEIIFTVKDCKKPTPICINGLSVDLMQDGTVSLWATDFEQGSSSDYCTPRNNLRIRINRIVDLNGDRQITPADYQMNVPATDTVMFRCRDFGINYVQVWVGDIFNNWDFCVTFIDVQDNMFMCRTGSKVIGNISTEKDKGVGGVKVDLSGNRLVSVMTSSDGMFDFPNVAQDYDYTLTPQKDEEPTNGVSTFDLTLISKHILGVQKLDSPYKIIAADANKSGTVTTFDMVELRKLILRVVPNFRNNTSWRFVRKDYRFPDPTNPFLQPFPEVLSMNNLSSDKLDADFVAIKIGDVNSNAKTVNLSGDLDDRSFDETLVIKTADKILTPGELVTIDFKPSRHEDLLGFQYTLHFEKEMLEFVNATENQWFGLENLGLAFLDEGVITTSWDNAAQKIIGDDELIITLTFRAKAPVQLSRVIKINSAYTAAEAYSFDGTMMQVALDFGYGTQNAGFDLYQNKPNPFADGTVIGFQLPQAGMASVTIYDVSGKVVKFISGNWQAGYHEIGIQRKDLPASGIFYYRLEAASNTATKKMILID